ncbi:MAG: type II secretion system protein N [Pseudomonadota bacterium]
MASLIIIGVVTFLAGMIAQFPLAAIVDRAGLPIGYTGVSGTIWNGEIRGLQASGQRVGDATLKVQALPLLTGRLLADVTLRGEGVHLDGRVGLRGATLVAHDLDADVRLERFALRDVFGQRLRGQLQANVKEFAFDRKGCRAADLTVHTDAIKQSLGAFADRGFDLSGQGRCEGDALVVPLSGAADDGSLAAELRLTPDGRYRSELSVIPEALALGAYLQSVGFERDGDRYLAVRSGSMAETL